MHNPKLSSISTVPHMQRLLGKLSVVRLFAYRRCQRCLHGLWPGNGIAVAPDWAWPGRIALPAADDMDMELRHHIAEVADIEFLDARQGPDQAGQFHDLGHQLGLVRR